MRWRLLLPIAVAAGCLTAALGFAIDDGSSEADVLGPGEVTVELGIEHSRFSFDRLEVREGSIVRFVVRNSDPINHELIVGDDDVHRRHRDGTEAVHPPVPGEVSVGPNAAASTIYEFDEPGTVVFACHLPGHLAYGMRGEVTVREA